MLEHRKSLLYRIAHIIGKDKFCILRAHALLFLSMRGRVLNIELHLVRPSKGMWHSTYATDRWSMKP